jgi:hypothetical protein
MGWWRSVKINWARFRRLSCPERGAFLAAMWLLPLTALGLRWLGFRRWQIVLARSTRLPGLRATGDMGDQASQAQDIARMVRVAARYGPCPATCLHQSLTLWWLLRRRGIASTLRIGVRKEANRLEAHAWVERLGIAVSEAEDPYLRFVPFEQLFAPEAGKSR